MPDRRDRDRALLRGRTGRSSHCSSGCCYYCGRDLVCAVPLAGPKYQALKAGYLTCGPCVYVEGRLPWRPAVGKGANAYARRRYAMRKALRGEDAHPFMRAPRA